MVRVIAHHPATEQSDAAQPLIALVHLSDLLCRMRGMGYGYYECNKVDWVADPAWSVLLKEHRNLADIDLALFSFELDEAVGEVFELVSTIFGGDVQRLNASQRFLRWHRLSALHQHFH